MHSASSRRSIHRSIFIFIVCFTILAGCNKEAEPSKDYLQRLASVLKQSVEPAAIKEQYMRLPSRRELQLAIPSGELSVREFLSIRQCKLHLSLAQRNSLIGKVASASQQLFNDVEILDYGARCLPKLESEILKVKLKQFLEQKNQHLKASLWNATLGGTEFQKFWSPHTQSQDYPASVHTATIPSLKSLDLFTQRVMTHPAALDRSQTRAIERSLGQLRHGDGGQLLAHYQRLRRDIKQANLLIEQAIKKPLCLQAQPTTEAYYLQNVVNKFFIDGVQAHSVALDKRQQALMTHYTALEHRLLEIAPPAYLRWRTQRNRLLNASQSVTAHARLLQTLYSQCGLTVGQ